MPSPSLQKMATSRRRTERAHRLGDRVEDRLADRVGDLRDDAEHLADRRLVFKALGQLLRAGLLGVNNLTFSMAMTAWSRNDFANAISFCVNSRGRLQENPITPRHSLPRMSGRCRLEFVPNASCMRRSCGERSIFDQSDRCTMLLLTMARDGKLASGSTGYIASPRVMPNPSGVARAASENVLPSVRNTVAKSVPSNRTPALDDRIEDRRYVGRRLADHAQNVGGGGLIVEGFGQLLRAGLLGLEQARVLDGDHGLVGEGLHQLDLALGKGLRDRAIKG